MENKRNIKKYVFIGVAIFIALLIAIISLIIILSKKEKIDLNSYLDITYSGFDGYGKAEYSIDYSSITKDYAKKIGLKEDSEIYEFEYYLSHYIIGEIDKVENLKNDEEIKFKWTVEKEKIEEKYDIELKYEVVYEKVIGLQAIVGYDPLENVIVEYNGMSKKGKAKIINVDETYSWIKYNLSKDYNLKNGDKITVEVLFDEGVEQLCIENGIKFSRLEKEFTVEGLGEYFSLIKDIPEEQMDKMKKQTEEVFRADVAKNWVSQESLNSMTYIGSYLLNSKSDNWGNYNNSLYLIYKIDVTNSFENLTYYYYTRFDNLYVTSEGEYVIDIMNYQKPYGYAGKSLGSWYNYGATIISGDYWYLGYKTLDEVFNECVTSNLDEYTYDLSVEE